MNNEDNSNNDNKINKINKYLDVIDNLIIDIKKLKNDIITNIIVINHIQLRLITDNNVECEPFYIPQKITTNDMQITDASDGFNKVTTLTKEIFGVYKEMKITLEHQLKYIHYLSSAHTNNNNNNKNKSIEYWSEDEYYLIKEWCDNGVLFKIGNKYNNFLYGVYDKYGELKLININDGNIKGIKMLISFYNYVLNMVQLKGIPDVKIYPKVIYNGIMDRMNKNENNKNDLIEMIDILPPIITKNTDNIINNLIYDDKIIGTIINPPIDHPFESFQYAISNGLQNIGKFIQAKDVTNFINCIKLKTKLSNQYMDYMEKIAELYAIEICVYCNGKITIINGKKNNKCIKILMKKSVILGILFFAII